MSDADSGWGWELSTELYGNIGRVAADWAALEATVDWATWEVANLSNEVGVSLTSQINGPGRKLDGLIAVATAVGVAPKHLAQLNKIAKETISAGERRNRVVHDPWIVVGDSPHRIVGSGRRVPRFELAALPDGFFESLIEDVRRLGERLTIVIQGVLDERES